MAISAFIPSFKLYEETPGDILNWDANLFLDLDNFKDLFRDERSDAFYSSCESTAPQNKLPKISHNRIVFRARLAKNTDVAREMSMDDRNILKTSGRNDIHRRFNFDFSCMTSLPSHLY